MVRRISSPQFVGRREELDALGRAFERASAGEPSTVLIAGEAGIGKTRMVREFVADVGSSAHVMYGACVPLADAGLPYGPVRDALRSFVRGCDAATLEHLKAVATPELSTIVPGLSDQSSGGPTPTESGFAQLRMFELLLNLLEHLAEGHPIVLALEDLHWADGSTLALVAFLIQNLRDAPVLVCATYRDDELHRKHSLKPWLAEQLRQERVVKLALPRFDRQEVVDQLEAIMGATPAPDLIENLLARSEGNPFLAEELVAGLAESGRAGMPGSLRELLLDRFLRLPDDAQALLRIASVNNRALHPWLLAKVSNMPEQDLYPALRDVVDHHILVTDQDSGRFSFRHALLREAIYSEVLPGECQNLHARYAEELAAAHATGRREAFEALPEIAFHWDAANNVQRALTASLDAAEWARSVFAFGSAQKSFERVLELWSAVPDAEELTGVDRAEVMFRTGQAAHFAGDIDRAIVLLRGALEATDEDSDPMRAALWHRELAWCHFQASSHADAETAIGHALNLSSGLPETPERAGILGTAARLLMLWGRYVESRTLCEQAIEIARRFRARREEAAALNPLGVILVHRGEFEEGIDSLRRSLAIAEEVGDAEAAAIAYINLGEVLRRSGRKREAADISRRGFPAARQMGLQRAYGEFIRFNEAEALFELGEWDTVRELLNEAAGRHVVGFSDQFLTQFIARMDAAQGVTESVEEQVEHLELIQRDSTQEMTREIFETIAELWVSAADLDRASAAVDQGLSMSIGTEEEGVLGHFLTLGLRVEADRAQLARARRAPDAEKDAIAAARALIARAESIASNPLDPSANPFPEAAAYSALAEAEIARAEGKEDAGLWNRAALLWEELEHPHRLAYTLWREAEAALGAGAPKRVATPGLRVAYEIAVRLGARPLRAEIESLARRARIELEMHETDAEARPPEEVVNSLGLSERELEVLKLVAEGLSNPQIGQALFISPKTASIHVSNILRKLGVSGRVEAAGIAHRVGLARSSPSAD